MKQLSYLGCGKCRVMVLDPMIIWTAVLTLVIGPLAWAFKYLVTEVKNLQLLLRETRETYVSKTDLQSDLTQLDRKIDRIEDLLIKVVGNLKIE